MNVERVPGIRRLVAHLAEGPKSSDEGRAVRVSAFRGGNPPASSTDRAAGPSTWDSSAMGELSATSTALVSTLHSMRADLSARGDVTGAEQLLQLMMATAAADEMVSAMERKDAYGVEFHLDLLQRNLEPAHPVG